MAATLIQSIAFSGFRADDAFPADINGDGLPELLFLQSPGIYQSRVFDGTRYAIPDHHKAIYCLTATARNGELLWQFGEPYMDSLTYQSHCTDQMVWCDDIDDDGRIEVLLVTPTAVLILDGATGTVKNSQPLDHVARDGYGVRICDFDGDGVAEILIHNRAEAWMFKPPYPKPDHEHTHSKLRPVTGQGWYSF